MRDTNREATDGNGWAKYVCAADLVALQSVPDEPGVLICPTCGHRTDTPGEGVLGDAFDIHHRQWGLRADPHIWWAVRDLVGATPTPATRDEIRAAFVDSASQVADVDLDHTDDLRPYRAHLDQGGMSGGFVDVQWWRTKGIPLLVDRADDRRPPAPAATTTSATGGTAGNRVVGVLVWLVVLAIPAALVGGGVFLLYQAAWGTPVEATVLSCDTTGGVFGGASTYGTDCVAEWEIDGRLVVGGFNGGNGESDVGKTVDATVRGDTAYSRSIVLPIVLLVLGLPFLAVPFFAIRRAFRRRRQSAAGGPQATGAAMV
ncbi:MAG: hypothetical protein R2697_09905 [Ilumatobacteraceae bacterium]